MDEPTNGADNNKSDSKLIPASIIFAGALIAFAVFYTSIGSKSGGQVANTIGGEKSAAAKNVRPVDSSDHIFGNPDARIKIVEYSDLECPFCKSYHPTLKQIIETYGKDGKVAWVYRHFPLDSIHPKSKKEAEASECAAELGGNNAFWNYIDRVFAITPSNNGLDPAKLPQIAGEIGLDRAKFQECLSSGRYAEKIARDYEDAVNSGGDGTPYTVIINSKGEMHPFAGAYTFAQLKPLVEEALDSL